MSGRCPSTSTPCHCSIQVCRVCPQCSRCLECAVRCTECSRCPECSQCSRQCVQPVSPGPSTSRSCPPISPGSSRCVPVSPGSSRVPPLSPATSLPRWNSSRDLWIGEETRRNMPPHIYKYYLQRTMCYRRQSFTKVRFCKKNYLT